jgi:spore maturation protein CgeB
MNNFALSQWAASHDLLAEPLPSQRCKYSVTFVGSAYGNRRKWIDRLRVRGIRVECFGHGWPSGPVPAADLPRIYRESVVTLNFGDSALQLNGILPYRSRQLKARVFEVPGAGGCLLTEHAQNLEQYFRIGEEILVFSGADELAGHIQYLLAHPERRDAISRKGFDRVRDEHTYDKRFSELFDKVMSPPTSKSVRSIDWVGFESAAARHSVGFGLRTLRRLLVGPARIMFGSRRGPRAARRLVFELSWRLLGERTYKAAGWPGRMFYRER